MKVILLLIFLLPLAAEAQFLNAFGIMVGATESTHRYRFTNTEFDNNKYITGANASVFWELFDKDKVRWQTEFQYNLKGSIDRYDETLKNRLHYACWNNYIKIRSMRLAGTPFVIAGPRMEYLIAQNTPSLDMVDANFEKFHVSGVLGLGWEFEVFKGPKPQVELLFNPDMFMFAYDGGDYKMKNFVLELRVGAKLFWHRDKCPRTNRK